MLIYPKSVKESLCRKLKINIDDTEATKYFMWPTSFQRKSCGEFFSNFNTSKCSCGSVMNKEIPSPEVLERVSNCCDDGGVFVHGDGNMAFILSDDLKIENFSRDLFRKKIKDLGCVNLLDEVAEGEAEIGFREAMNLLRYLFTSETPLTNTFFPFQSQVLSLEVYLSKDRRKVVLAECGEGFIDLICTFLVLPLEYICEISGGGGDDGLGCMDNLFRSFKVQNPHIFYHQEGLKHVIAIDPKIESGQPRSSDLTMRELDDLKISLNDVTIEQITIGRVEAINLLKASFATSSALTNGLSE
ncbi:hypothetical protein Bca52824_017547 [Brassica carinata]|uniref:Uncharacterized protein n=1 Tax=Brassica carinata TaxID=52824 RepID=A0A8X8AWF2_BRACI|nr:hypothetical protein Bca52824_017547 [Brassica carinata]